MPAVLPFQTPIIIGHRGAAAHAPENTLASIREAAAQGVTIVEFDATISGDYPPQAIIIHDDTLDRTTNGTGAVDKMPFTALRQLDAGDGERIPTLQEIIAEVHRLGMTANVEIKVAPDRDRETAEAVIADLVRYWPEQAAPPVVSSLSIEALEIAQRERPDWPRGIVLRYKPDNWRELADRLDLAIISYNVGIETPDEIDKLFASGRHIMAFTVNDAEQAKALLERGVAGIFTDTPRTLLPVLAEFQNR